MKQVIPHRTFIGLSGTLGRSRVVYSLPIWFRGENVACVLTVFAILDWVAFVVHVSPSSSGLVCVIRGRRVSCADSKFLTLQVSAMLVLLAESSVVPNLEREWLSPLSCPWTLLVHHL